MDVGSSQLSDSFPLFGEEIRQRVTDCPPGGQEGASHGLQPGGQEGASQGSLGRTVSFCESGRNSEKYSKRFVAASKCVSGNDSGCNLILSEQIYPSAKTILEIKRKSSPVGRRE